MLQPVSETASNAEAEAAMIFVPLPLAAAAPRFRPAL